MAYGRMNAKVAKRRQTVERFDGPPPGSPGRVQQVVLPWHVRPMAGFIPYFSAVQPLSSDFGALWIGNQDKKALSQIFLIKGVGNL
jgi:hypothetical protein